MSRVVSCFVLVLLLAIGALHAGCGGDRSEPAAQDGVKRLRIRVRDPDGKPIPRALVHVVGMWVPPKTYEADSTGTAIAEVPVGEKVNIRFGGHVAEGHGDARRLVRRPLEVETKDVPAETTEVELRARAIPTDRRLTLHVLDPDGQPLPGATIRVRPDPEGRESRTTDEEGRLRLERMPAVPHAIWVDVRGTRKQPWVAPPPLSITPEDQEETLRLDRGLVVDGRLLDADGKPARGGVVTVQVGTSTPVSTLVEPEGYFLAVVRGRPSDRLTLRSDSKNRVGVIFKAALVDVPATERPFTLRLGRFLPED